MKSCLKKGISIVLALTMGIGLLSGCGDENDDKDSILSDATKNSKDYVFALEALDSIPNAQSVNNIFSIGDKVGATAFDNDGNYFLYSFNSDGSDLKTIKLPVQDNMSYSYLGFDAEENLYAVYYKYSWVGYSDEDSEISIQTDDDSSASNSESDAENDTTEKNASEDADSNTSDNTENKDADKENEESVENETTENEASEDTGTSETEGTDECYLIKLDKDQNEVDRVDLMAEFGEDGYVSVNGFQVMDDGTVLLSVDKGICTYTKESGFKFVVESSNSDQQYYYQIYKGFGDKYFVSYYGDKGIQLCSFDVKNGTLGEPSKAISDYGSYSFFGGSGYDLYVSTNTAIFGYDLASDSLTKILDYVDSDLEITDSITSVVAISDVEFVASLPDAEYNYYLARLTKVPADQVKDKQIITLGGYYIDYDVRRRAFDFNKKSNEYKIKFVDYSSYDTDDNYGAGSEKLNMDIVSGKTPDILILDDSMPVDSYINKGLFQDLTNYFNNDPDVSPSDFLTNIFDAFKTGDKIYQVVPGFSIGTMIIKTKFTEGKDILTFKDCEELMKKTGVSKQSAFGMFTRDSFLESGIRYSGNTYIDWENKTCHFDSDSFIEFLEFSKDFPTEYSDDAWNDYKDTLYLTEDALFFITSLAEFRDFKYYKRGMFGADVSYVGYPNDMGINNSVIYPNKRLAISSQCKNKDSAWEFVKSFLTEESQDSMEYTFPIRKSSLDKCAEKAMQKPYYMDGDNKVEYDETYYIGGQEISVDPLTNEEVVEIENFIKSLTLVSNYNANVDNIIFEEASAYYSGQKTAKEVADIIQSRLSIYVNENS